jgi:hypothetical protein
VGRRTKRRTSEGSARQPDGATPTPRVTAALSLLIPGLGQLVRGRVVTGLLLLLGALVPYVFFLALLNDRYGVRGGLLSFSFDATRGPIRPAAEHWSLLVLGVAIHALAIWDARRRGTASANAG